MSDSVIALMLVLELAGLLLLRRMYSWCAVATVFGAYLIFAQGTAWLAAHGVINHDMMQLYGGADPDADLRAAIAFAGALFAAVAALQRLTTPEPHDGPLPDAARTAVLGAHGAGWIIAALWAMAALAASRSLDWSRLWFTPDYLALTDPATMTGDALAGLGLTALPLLGALAAALAALVLGAGEQKRADVLLAGLLIAQAMATTLWLMAAHSRAAATPPAAFMLTTALTTRPRPPYGLVVCAAALVIITLAGALAGRGLERHGLASLAEIPDLLATPRLWAPQLVTNVAEGIFAVASGMGEWRAGAQGVSLFPNSYVWLSFSPLPSIIDGFSAVLAAQVRLHEYAPMPGYVELAWFGLPWLVVFLVILATGMALAARASRTSPMAGGGAALLLAASLYLMAAYPVRTALKPLWFSVGVASIAILAGAIRGDRLARHEEVGS